MKRNIILTFVLFFSILTIAQTKYVGGDISMLPSYEAANVAYKDAEGKKITNLIEFFRDKAGYNIARVRLFVNPDKTDVGVVQDLQYAVALSKRIKDAGLALMFDFHYSDTWADPSNQWTPAAWTSIPQTALPDTVYQYTKRVLETLVAEGAAPDFIQTGNEISYGMLWGPKGTKTYYCHYDKDANWARFVQLLQSAGKACREICPDAKIIIHTERTNNWGGTQKIYNRLASVDYDVIGLSYYPEWHGDLSSLKSILNNIHANFSDKEIMIVETGYYNNWYPENATYKLTSTWPASPDGQKKFLDDLVAAVKDMDFMKSILYWFPEENPYQNRVYEPWYNHGLFNPNTGQVSDALFSLQTLRGLPTAVETVGIDAASRFPSPQDAPFVYTVDGRSVSNNGNLPQGIYIHNGKKYIR
ncbi:MAG: glycosyl hydrolase 53 family protein [Paludibacteraceae bacterium]|nr:glycosyl hydrolase 53 family protein [Paludibacteraceae bacterium]